MSAINSTQADGGVSSLARALFQKVDGNGDGKLSTIEFQSFLENLVGAMGSKQTPGLGTASTAVTTGPRSYQGMLGFDYVKLNTPGHTTPKYVFGRATQEVPLGWDRESRSAGLSQIVSFVKERGYPNAVVTGDDTIDFGDGNGNIDVLTGDGQWWWGPKG